MGTLEECGRKFRGVEFMFRRSIRMGEEIKQMKWVFSNSFYELKHAVVEELSEEVGVYPVGPLFPSKFLELDARKIMKVLPDKRGRMLTLVGQTVCKIRDLRIIRKAILKMMLALGIYSIHSIAKAENGQVDSLKIPEQLEPNKKTEPIKKPEQLGPNMKNLPSTESNKSDSRINDATVIGEPVAIGKDRQRVWNKLLQARIIYLGEADHVPDLDDKIWQKYSQHDSGNALENEN
ncbi:hypothetical protein KI387_000407 [Taxus chinensis]|uniref:Uncharacterized protein n=1 Tax=Taxus chinensis TaxID=29808 RepID=A0AA38GRR2_TAXCH|nr:hypothetical protein KI387_000407 [Taxus chinensis]